MSWACSRSKEASVTGSWSRVSNGDKKIEVEKSELMVNGTTYCLQNIEKILVSNLSAMGNYYRILSRGMIWSELLYNRITQVLENWKGSKQVRKRLWTKTKICSHQNDLQSRCYIHVEPLLQVFPYQYHLPIEVKSFVGLNLVAHVITPINWSPLASYLFGKRFPTIQWALVVSHNLCNFLIIIIKC